MTDRRAERPDPRRQKNGLLVPVIVLLLSVGACSTMPPPSDVTPPPSAGRCNADAARFAIGREPTPDLVERARAESGSATVRVIRPGDVVTMDHREDRLNLDVNERNAITGARCG